MSILSTPRLQYLDASGVPYPSAKASFFASGTSTPVVVYTDALLTTPHPLTITQDGSGYFPPIYINPADGDLKLVVTDQFGGNSRTTDPVTPELYEPTAYELATILNPQSPAEEAAGVVPSNYVVDTTDYSKLERYFSGTIANGADITTAIKQALSIAKGVQLPGYEMVMSEIPIPAGSWIKGIYSRTILKPANGGVSKLLNLTGTGYPTGTKLFTKLSDFFLYNNGATTSCTAIHGEYFDELDIDQVIVDGFYKNVELKNFSFAYLRRLRSWSATAQNLRVDCDSTTDPNVHVNGWLKINDSEFFNAQGVGPVADELYGAYIANTATVRIYDSEFHANAFGGLAITQPYNVVPREACDVLISGSGFDSNARVGLRLKTIRSFSISGKNWFSGGRSGTGYSGMEIDTCGHGNVEDNDFYNNGDCGLKVANSYYLGIHRNRASCNGQTGSGERAGIYAASTTNLNITENNLIDEAYGRTSGQQNGLKLDTCDDATIIGNKAALNIANQIIPGAGARLKIRDNSGYVSENSGTASITSGSTSVAVTHGLSFTPGAKDIVVSPASAMGSAAKFWVSSPTSTQFTINVDANPGTTISFSWRASYSP